MDSLVIKLHRKVEKHESRSILTVHNARNGLLSRNLDSARPYLLVGFERKSESDLIPEPILDLTVDRDRQIRLFLKNIFRNKLFGQFRNFSSEN